VPIAERGATTPADVVATGDETATSIQSYVSAPLLAMAALTSPSGAFCKTPPRWPEVVCCVHGGSTCECSSCCHALLQLLLLALRGDHVKLGVVERDRGHPAALADM
jgi:hypothetical protein